MVVLLVSGTVETVSDVAVAGLSKEFLIVSRERRAKVGSVTGCVTSGGLVEEDTLKTTVC